MNQQKQESPPIEHENLSHVPSRWQTTEPRVPSQQVHKAWAAPKVQAQPSEEGAKKAYRSLSRSAGMGVLSGLKGGSLIGFLLVPQGKNHSHPDIGEGSNGFAMAFALCPFALIVVSGPLLLFGRLPSKLMQGITQGVTTRVAPMRFSVGSALKKDRRGSGQGCQTGAIPIAASVIANFGQQSRSKPLASPRQGAEEPLVFMLQKKGSNLLVVLSNRFNQWQELVHQNHGQTRFG